MTNSSIFIEDIFLEFFDTISESSVYSLEKQDSSPIYSFYNTILIGQHLTENQANYILRLLEKYKNLSASLEFDYQEQLKNPQWKNSFRVIDMSKKVFVELDDSGIPWICLQFPFQLKKTFETEILSLVQDNGYKNIWDKDRRLRMLCLYDFNIIKVDEFVKKHGFEIDETFFEAVASVEEIWNSSDVIETKSIIEDNQVKLINASKEVEDWFDTHKSGSQNNDLLLAKSMGYIFNQDPANKAQKIASSDNNQFWVQNYSDLFEICSELTGKVCFIIDRTVNSLEWLKTLSMYIDSDTTLKRNEFKVCFRESNKENPEFNNWVRDNGFGGSVKDGKYLIFQHRPAKWVFSDADNIKMIVTNNVYPSTNSLTKMWIKHHPCVIYMDKIKPSDRSNDIVKL